MAKPQTKPIDNAIALVFIFMIIFIVVDVRIIHLILPELH